MNGDVTKGINGPGAKLKAGAFAPGKRDRGNVLVEVELKRWSVITPQIRQRELGVFNDRFHELLNELYDSANLCVDLYQSFAKTHVYWRRTLIVGTGFVAIVNLLAANDKVTSWSGETFSVVAAVLAVILAILANLESFYNAAEKAEGYRQSRELFLDAARDYDHRWDVYVRPLSDNAEACVNAAELYRQLVAKDSELRAKFKELTKRERKPAKGGE